MPDSYSVISGDASSNNSKEGMEGARNFRPKCITSQFNVFFDTADLWNVGRTRPLNLPHGGVAIVGLWFALLLIYFRADELEVGKDF